MKKNQLLFVNRVCDDFESQLKSGGDSSIDDILNSEKEDLKDQQLVQLLLPELIALKIIYSQDRLATAQELRSRYPDQSSEIQAALEQPSLLGTVGVAAVDTGIPGPDAQLNYPSTIPKIGARFENLQHHASGGLGAVYIGYDKSVRRRVAIKLLKPGLANDRESRARFLNEGAITGMLEHPGIVPIYDSGSTEDGQPYYAMRLLDGQTLRGAILDLHQIKDAAEFDAQQRILLRYLIQVCEAISYAHDQGVIHRDLKPANILLGKYGEMLVIDWGLARHDREASTIQSHSPMATSSVQPAGSRFQIKPVDSADSNPATKLGQVLGTPAYMSPEQASGDSSKVGKPSDVYSLGAILYCILTGSSPLNSDAAASQDLLDKIHRGEYPTAKQLNPNVADSLNAICLQAMNANPNERYDSPSALANDVERWLSDQPISARPDSRLEKFSRFLRKHRRWAAAAAATLVTITMGSAIALAIIGSQSKQLVQQKLDAEKQARIQAELAAKEAESARIADSRSAENQAYFNVTDQAFLNLLGQNTNLDPADRNVRIKDLTDEIGNLLETQKQKLPEVARLRLLGHIVTGLTAAGDYEEGLVRGREYLDLAVSIDGETSFAGFDAYGNLANLLYESGEHVKSIESANRALEIRDAIEIPSENEIRAKEIETGVINRRISSLRLLDRFEDAMHAQETNYPWLKELDMENLPKDREELLIASQYINDKARASGGVGAVEWQMKIYAIQKAMQVEPDSRMLGSLHRIAQALLREQGPAAAMPYQKELVEAMPDVFGAQHPNTITSNSNLANMRFNTGEYKESQEAFLEIHSVLLGQKNALKPRIIVEHKLVRGHLFLGQEKEALELIRTVVPLAVESESIGPTNRASIIAKHLLAYALIENGRVEEAVDILESEIELLTEAGEKYKSDVDDCHVLMQRCFLMLGDFESALQIREHIDLEVTHQNILQLGQTAEALCRNNEIDQAKKLIQQIIDLPPRKDHRTPYLENISLVTQAKMKGLLASLLVKSDLARAKQLYAEAVQILEVDRFMMMRKSQVKRSLELIQQRYGDALKRG